MKEPYQLSPGELFDHFQTSASGLTTEASAQRLKELGENAVRVARPKSKLTILLSQFADLIIAILLVAAIISLISGEQMDAVVILAIIAANAWVGYLQEYKAEEAIRMLQKMTPLFAIALRNQYPVKIAATALVTGDVILLEAGNIVPADARVIEAVALTTDESSLTGESLSAEKKAETLPPGRLVPGDQYNMVFKGTTISSGSAKAVVTATGMQTEIGKIAGMLERESPKTPLQKRMAIFSRQLAAFVILICLAVFFMGLWRGEPAFVMFLTALSLAVAALPEALPAVIAIALARGAGRMAQQKALVRKLPAVETLGSVTYICSDKTGTLTQNVMTVGHIHVVPGKKDLLMWAMLLNNDVQFSAGCTLLGDSTEKALVDHALKQGYSRKAAEAAFPLVRKIPFDPARMRMGTLHQHEGRYILFVKGAPSKILAILSPQYNSTQKKEWLEINHTWAAEGMRVLFFAYKILEQKPACIDHCLEEDMAFLGMAAMIDPPRTEVTRAIEQCKTAGIKTVMITGDQPGTAKAIAERLGIIGSNGASSVKTGNDLDRLDERAFDEAIKMVSVYARVSPEQKLHFIQGLQRNGEFVAMTGDGINDAPSLKQADIGVAMGITGTDVSKEAADMILLDDNFATIIRAVREGRRIYDNIRKFIQYVLSCNLGEILTILLAPICGFDIPLLPIHILWINLVTDGLPGLALAAEPAEKKIMQRPPRSPKESFFSGGMVTSILLTSIIITASSIAVQWWAASKGYALQQQQTMVFLTLCMVQLANAVSVRSPHPVIFSPRLFANKSMWAAIIVIVILMATIIYVPFLQPVFKTTGPSAAGLLVVLLATVVSFCSIEGFKMVLTKH